MKKFNYSEQDIEVIGLGYVGLPLAVEFSKKRKVIAFDINESRIRQLKKGIDKTKEVELQDLDNRNLIYTFDKELLTKCKIFIITVPTPINKKKEPDLSYLKQASRTVGNSLTKDSLVIYESTVYPGATEEICIPILEKFSKLKCTKKNNFINDGFYCGYSPERINPGDKRRKILFKYANN